MPAEGEALTTVAPGMFAALSRNRVVVFTRAGILGMASLRRSSLNKLFCGHMSSNAQRDSQRNRNRGPLVFLPVKRGVPTLRYSFEDLEAERQTADRLKA
jgi:hypothetical protein